jgi:predicted GNAT family acetyltransferase
MTATHDAERQRFTLPTPGGEAFLAYALGKTRIALLHTEVPPRSEGQGVGGALVQSAMDYARAHDLRVLPYCPFVQAWLTRHDDYADLVQPSRD